MLNKLKELNVNSIQISLDGDKDYHNTTRCLKNGEGTFDTIINNLLSFKDIYKNNDNNYPQISLRVNVTRQNMKSIKGLVEELEKLEILKFTTLYFAKIFDNDDPYEKTLRDKEFNVLKIKYIDKLENIFDKKDVDLFYYPKRLTNNCTCDFKNSFIIDPKGNIYKCWEEIGQNENIIGNINSGIKENKPNVYYQHLLYNPINNRRCRNCDILPLCMGGECPKRRSNLDDNDCYKRKEKFLKNMNLTFKKLGYNNVVIFE